MTDPHAVRWARRKVRREMDYTKWHWTEDARFTICHRIIGLAFDQGTFLPETSDETEDVTCYFCRRYLKAANLK